MERDPGTASACRRQGHATAASAQHAGAAGGCVVSCGRGAATRLTAGTRGGGRACSKLGEGAATTMEEARGEQNGRTRQTWLEQGGA